LTVLSFFIDPKYAVCVEMRRYKTHMTVNSSLTCDGVDRDVPMFEELHDCVLPACKGAITSKIKHAIKHKTSPARLSQLLQPSLAFCFSLQPMTAYRPVLDGTPSLAASENKMLMRAATVVQVLQDLFLCFIACFILLVIAP